MTDVRFSAVVVVVEVIDGSLSKSTPPSVEACMPEGTPVSVSVFVSVPAGGTGTACRVDTVLFPGSLLHFLAGTLDVVVVPVIPRWRLCTALAPTRPDSAPAPAPGPVPAAVAVAPGEPETCSSAGGVFVNTSADKLAKFMRALAEGSHFQLLSGVLIESKGE